jgi:hypothetical protein
MAPFKPRFGHLDKCEAGELVRMKVGDTSTWAIVCVRQGAFAHTVVLLGGREGARSRNIRSEGRASDVDIPVLRYGKDFDLEVDHSGPVVLVLGEIKKIPGRVLQAGDDLYLVAAMEEGGIDYISLGSGSVHSEPGGPRALFSRWTLSHHHITRDGFSIRLLEFEAGKSATQKP